MLRIITDFDGTLMHQDVGDTLMKTLGVTEQEDVQEASRLFREKIIGSYEWIKVAYRHLEDKQAQVDPVLESIRLRDGAEEFLAYCRDNGMPVTILSDGMAYYIDRLTKKLGVEAHQIVVNPIHYLPGETEAETAVEGRYRLELQNQNEACRWCGCCKADIVRGWKEKGDRIIYIGDGSSDLYGSAYADYVFARSSLARHLENAGEPFFRFESFLEILDIVSSDLQGFQNGTAPGSRSGPPSDIRCRFVEHDASSM